MTGFSWRMAWRYLVGTGYEKNISTMIKICGMSIAIGAFALALVMSVMQGFERAVYEKMQGVHAQITMRSIKGPLDTKRIVNVLKEEFPDIIAWSPASYGQVILHKTGSEDLSNAVLIKGIVPKLEVTTSSIAQKLIEPKNDNTFEQNITKNHILIGAETAKNIKLNVGDPIQLLFIEDQTPTKHRVTLASQQAIIGGIFKTGIDDFDQNIIISNLSFTEQLFPEQGITHINLNIQPDVDEQQIIQELRNRFDLEVYTWKDLYLPLVSALKLEKFAMFFILALIMLVACMNMISLLFMLITQKRGDIAILKAMGTSVKQIKSIFLLIGITLSSIGAFLGLSFAWIVGILLQRYPFITLPDVYYTSTLPIHLSAHTFIFIFILTVFMGIVASLLPIRNIKNINIANILRFEV